MTKTQITLATPLHFSCKIIGSKLIIFEVFSHLKEPLVITVSKTCTLTFAKHVVEQDMKLAKPPKNINCLGCTFPFFLICMSIFEVRLPLKEPFVATFSKMCALKSRKHVVEKGLSVAKLSENLSFVSLLRFWFWEYLPQNCQFLIGFYF